MSPEAKGMVIYSVPFFLYEVCPPLLLNAHPFLSLPAAYVSKEKEMTSRRILARMVVKKRAHTDKNSPCKKRGNLENHTRRNLRKNPNP